MKLLIVSLFVVVVASKAINDGPIQSQKLQPFIVGGAPVELNQFSFTVAIIRHLPTGNGFCTGSAITKKFVLTTAVCIRGIPSVVVVVNVNNLNNPLEPGQRRLFSEDLRPHADFVNDGTNLNDIGLIQLPEDLTFTGTFQPIRLVSIRQVGQTFNNVMSTISGFGSIDNTGIISPQMHAVSNPIISNLNCRLSYPITGIANSQICVSGDGGRGPCTGDAGAPVTVVELDGVATQVGIVSWGSLLSCTNDMPSVNTRITSFLEWIAENSDYILN